MKEIDTTKLPFGAKRCVWTPDPDGLALVAHLKEPLSPMDRARAFRRLAEAAGLNVRQLALRLGVSTKTVARSLALLKLPDSIQGQIIRGTISQAQGYELSRMVNPTHQSELASLIVTQGLTLADVVMVVRGSQTKRTDFRRGQTTMVFRINDCRIVVRREAGIEAEGMRAAMLGFAKQLCQEEIAFDAA